jgi:hypothetical protein
LAHAVPFLGLLLEVKETPLRNRKNWRSVNISLPAKDDSIAISASRHDPAPTCMETGVEARTD